MKAQIRKQNPFRVEAANDLYNKYAANSDVYEYGIDTNGDIYFAYMNGVIRRYSRRQFINMSRV